MEFDYDAALATEKQEMEAAEDALCNSGFNADHWMLIKKYIGHCIAQNQLLSLKIVASPLPPEEPAT